ncbi:MAG TPA: ATP-dependent DNA helicase RecG [Wenzhouxiangella sp.]|nr:ATP-dependent DNA helicase RecG [Wenzhouxiangella sp.]
MPASGTRPVTELDGVGPQVASRLKALGIVRELDLLFHLPLRYEDRTRIVALGRVLPDTRVQVQGRVIHQDVVQRRRRMLVVTLADDTGQLTLRFFRFYPSQQRLLAEGNVVRCFGEVRAGPAGLEMAHPEIRQLGAARPDALPTHLTAIYSTVQGLAKARIASLVEAAVQRLAEGGIRLADPLGDRLAPDLTTALLTAHRPAPDEDLDALAHGSHPAVQRLASEELLAHHLVLARASRARDRQQAVVLEHGPAAQKQLLEQVGFEPTAAQQRVMTEIAADIARSRPMRRLLQGDVGSGKTLVAASALLAAAAAGRQAAIVAPTEILAEQHMRTLGQWFEPLGLELVWLAGKVTGKARRQALEKLAGDALIAVGTHALFQESVAFRDLALVVIDEQHRFGVHQRLALASKGSSGQRSPHQLIMTATPIPRTLAMTAYAGLDVSVIDQLPPGRKPVRTAAMSDARRADIIQRLRLALAQGRQAYWVCPLVEESELLEAQAAESTAETLAAALPEFTVGLVHGRLKADEKQRVMDDFAHGRIHLLVATTVIEVGVDVPNASLMIIDNAERLGLSQLHQLRGRVGRGSEQAACVLVYKPPLGTIARQRLEVMRTSNDGFEIAEKDLELRGPGEVLGTRQTGMLRFRVADLERDGELIEGTAGLAAGLAPSGADVVIDRWLGDAEQFVEV